MGGSGTIDYNNPIATVDHLGTGTHTWKSDALTDGTYKFAVRAVDDATNEETNVTSTSVTISTYPLAPTDLEYTFNDTTDKVTLTWTASASADIASYRIYSNGGSGYIDYDTVVATVSHPTVTWTSGAISSSGIYNYGVRAVDSGNKEEFNTDVIVSVDIIGPPITEQPDVPNEPTGLTATATGGGKITVAWVYNDREEDATPTKFNVYYDNGTGNVDYNTPLTSVNYSTGTQDGRHLAFSYLTAALTDTTTYIFGVRSSTATDEEDNTTTVSATADASAPNAPTGLSGSVTY